MKFQIVIGTNEDSDKMQPFSQNDGFLYCFLYQITYLFYLQKCL